MSACGCTWVANECYKYSTPLTPRCTHRVMTCPTFTTPHCPSIARSTSLLLINGWSHSAVSWQALLLFSSPVITPLTRPHLHRPNNYPRPPPPLPQQTFNFDHSFWTFNKKDATYVDQVGVFDALGPDIMVNVFEGFNACVFAYGQTGSGKTYTMMGEAQATCVLSLSYLRTLDDRTHMSSSYHADIGSLVPYAIRVTPSL
jgi:hypothetical protein